jgi:hypothetical protein
MRKLIPVNGKVIIRQKAVKSASLILPTGQTESIQRAEGYIISKADDCDELYKVGALVAYGKYAALDLDEPGEENLRMIDEGSITHIIEENEENN